MSLFSSYKNLLESEKISGKKLAAYGAGAAGALGGGILLKNAGDEHLKNAAKAATRKDWTTLDAKNLGLGKNAAGDSQNGYNSDGKWVGVDPSKHPEHNITGPSSIVDKVAAAKKNFELKQAAAEKLQAAKEAGSYKGTGSAYDTANDHMHALGSSLGAAWADAHPAAKAGVGIASAALLGIGAHRMYMKNKEKK